MRFIGPLLLSLVIFTTCHIFSAKAAEKGGNGIFGADLIAIENFKKSRSCPEIEPKKLCSRIDENMKLPKWELGNISEEDRDMEDFYINCCFKKYPSKD